MSAPIFFYLGQDVNCNNLYHLVEKDPTSPPPQTNTLTSVTSEGLYEPVEVLHGSFADESFDDDSWSSEEFEPIETTTASTQKVWIRLLLYRFLSINDVDRIITALCNKLRCIVVIFS